MKYLKQYWLSIVLALGLLFGQATCELTMPDYMQNIVNTGIQNGGIESGVYEQIRESTFNSYVMFATDSEKDLMTSSYKLVTPSKATKEEKTRIPALKTENVYLLKDISEEKEEKLSSTLTLLQMTMVEVSKDAKESNVQIPQLVMMNGIETYRNVGYSEISILVD